MRRHPAGWHYPPIECQEFGATCFSDSEQVGIHLLSFNPEPLAEAAAWIEAQCALWTARLDALDDLLQAEDPDNNP